MKSRDLSCDCLIGSTSRPYSKIGIHFSIEAHTGTPPAADWKRPPGRPRRNWLQQLEEDTGLSVGAAWVAGQDRSMWRTLRPSAGQAQQWVSKWVNYLKYCENDISQKIISELVLKALLVARLCCLLNSQPLAAKHFQLLPHRSWMAASRQDINSAVVSAATENFSVPEVLL